jgi:hypothetical protein
MCVSLYFRILSVTLVCPSKDAVVALFLGGAKGIRSEYANKIFLVGIIGRHYTQQFDILVAEHAGQGVLVVPNVLFLRKIEIVLLRDAQIIVLWKWGQIFIPRFVCSNLFLEIPATVNAYTCPKIGLISSRCMILLVQFVEMIEASNALPSTI